MPACRAAGRHPADILPPWTQERGHPRPPPWRRDHEPTTAGHPDGRPGTGHEPAGHGRSSSSRRLPSPDAPPLPRPSRRPRPAPLPEASQGRQACQASPPHAEPRRGAPLLLLTAPLPRTPPGRDRKSTRLNSSHVRISYAVFCLKKKTHTPHPILATLRHLPTLTPHFLSNPPPPPQIYTLSLHDALPICRADRGRHHYQKRHKAAKRAKHRHRTPSRVVEHHYYSSPPRYREPRRDARRYHRRSTDIPLVTVGGYPAVRIRVNH